jgi:hypothetical protein
MSIRSAASVCQFLHEMELPRGARMSARRIVAGECHVRYLHSHRSLLVCHASRAAMRAPCVLDVEPRVQFDDIEPRKSPCAETELDGEICSTASSATPRAAGALTAGITAAGSTSRSMLR